MAKRQHSISLSFVLLRFAIVMMGSMLLCFLIWLATLQLLEKNEIIYHGSVSNQQVEKMLAGKPLNFISPDNNFLAKYALFGKSGEILESNVEGKELEILTVYLKENIDDIHSLQYTYPDGNTIVIRWNYRREFVNPSVRSILPPFEYLWWGILGIAWILCLIFNTLWLRYSLAAKLKLFSEVSEKVAAQELEFEIPHAGIREYDQALDAMENMRKALYNSLSLQWAAKQERESEIQALAHDLKTPLTLIGGNAELLLDEGLPDNTLKMVKTIISSNDRSKNYVASLLETSIGIDEEFEKISLYDLLNKLYQNTMPIAENKKVCLQKQNRLDGIANIQEERLLRALGNIVQNAIEHTEVGRNVYLEGKMINSGWQIIVRDEGPGFSNVALQHATERLWRDDTARAKSNHNGIGLWFALQVVEMHAGQIKLQNYDCGGLVTIEFQYT
ncbi:ATP-binding protein [Clostridium tertium]|uniref:ATP-binding protein n=1 Tax=Clostridium tertium TaxID=1559 RepID=UPI001AE47F5F|nr:ATP-binding protein [Clostridium tertium]MBP1868826.1 signal transduction histidine kinase [Clostridium tertium]